LKALQAKLHNASDKHRNSGMFGAALMGAFSALIVGPCVAAPLAGALIFIGQSGDAVLGGAALFVMGLGMGAPLLALGASAGSILPKAGHWMNATKALFGVIMLAVAVWMLERILPAPVTLFLWALLLILPAIFLSALDALPENSSGWRRIWKGLGLIMLIYGTLLLIGLAMGNNNPLKPLQGFSAASNAAHQELVFQRIVSVQDLDRQLQRASAQGQWVILDYYADWCISCKEMEAYTFSDPEVQKALVNFVLLQADVTQMNDDDKALLEKFKLIGPPAILFFDTKKHEHKAMRVVGYLDSEQFIKHLQKTKL
jgi:thiol:disulfide interchange protein DsbD